MAEALNLVKLSLMDALLVESLRSLGWSNEELLRRVAEVNLPLDESEYEFDYKQLTILKAEKPEEFEQAVREGYQIKYCTIRGIRSWIAVTLGKEAVLELEEGKESVEVALTVAEKSRLESVLSFGWEIHNEPQEIDSENAIYRIEPIRIVA